MEQVNTFSNFNILGIKNKFCPLLRAWYLLRHHNTEKYGGNGWLSHKEALLVLNDYYELNRPREILKSGVGKWWKIDGDGYKLFGIVTVARILNHKPGHRVEVPIEAFSTIQIFRAHCYATFFAFDSSLYRNEKGKNISRAALEELFGVSVPTQINYEKLAKVKVEKRTAYEDIPRFDGENYIPEEKAIKEYQDNHGGFYYLDDIDNDGFKEAVYQMTNCYYVDSVVYKSNENKRVRNIGRSDQRDGASQYLNDRVYFDHIKQLEKIKNKKSVHDYSYLSDKKLSKKRGHSIHRKIRN